MTVHVEAAPLTSVAWIVKSLPWPGDELAGAEARVVEREPGVPAFVRSMRPAPRASTLARACLGRVVQTSSVAVVISADLTCAGVQLGCSCRSSAAEPATCGAAMLVPDAEPKPVNGIGKSPTA